MQGYSQYLAFSPPQPGAQQNPLGFMVPLGLMLAIFWFLILRPQQKKQKNHQRMIDALAKGDRILTSGGLYADVLNVKDDMIVATIADGVKIELAKHSVTALVKARGK
jgi:preprotein translocase subunit YajC